MRSYDWTPEKYKSIKVDENDPEKFETIEKEALFKGSVTLSIPKYTQRLKYLKDCNMTVKNGEVSEDGQGYDRMLKFIEIAKKHITKIQLVRIDDGMEFTDLEDLEYDKDGSEILNQIATTILQGVRLGKSQQKK